MRRGFSKRLVPKPAVNLDVYEFTPAGLSLIATVATIVTAASGPDAAVAPNRTAVGRVLLGNA